MGSSIHAPVLAAAALCLALAACESANKVTAEQKQVLGEDVAYQRPSLSVPPGYGERPEPKAEAQEGEQDLLTRRQRAVRQGEEVFAGGGYSPGTEAILKRTGVPSTPPNIRELVRRESTIVSLEDRRFVDRLLFGDGIDGGSGGPEIVLRRDGGPLPF